MNTDEMLLSELFRPKSIDDLHLTKKDLNFLKSMSKNKKNIKNLLFFGAPGIGKTSAARILIDDMDMSAMTLDARSLRGKNSIKNVMEDFFSAVSFDGNYKTVIMNEADALKKSDQTYLLDAIERFANSGRFILTANNITRIILPLKSRLTQINFDVPQPDQKTVIAKIIARYERILGEHGRRVDAEIISKKVHIYFPDLRTVANELEKEIMSKDF